MSPFHPFGEVSCELEKRKFGGRYSEYYFTETPFTKPAMAPETYLIIGRRGSGKTSLSEYFGFQDELEDSSCIDVNEPGVYSAILNEVSRTIRQPSELAIPLIKDIWEYTIWQLVLHHLKGRGHKVKAQSIVEGEPGSASAILRSVLTGVLQKYVIGEGTDLSPQLTHSVRGAGFDRTRDAVLEATRETPVIVAIDSMEHYSTEDPYVMWATAALVECASYLNAEYAEEGLHVKVFLTDEIFPYFQENVVTNVSKHIRHPLFLHWRPRDLARLVCWRLHKYLEQSPDHEAPPGGDIDWTSYRAVIGTVWEPFFGSSLNSGSPVHEHTFAYVLRHTQMRPRQLMMICNRIARMARDARTFPEASPDILTQATHDESLALSNEVVSSYSRIWPNAGQIIGALSGMPSRFEGRELDRVARRTAAEWPSGFSRSKFKRMVTELGIVGRQRRGPSGSQGVVEADFEFLLEDRLFLTEQDVCVIHPMFHRKLNTDVEPGIVVYPFPDRPEFQELRIDG